MSTLRRLSIGDTAIVAADKSSRTKILKREVVLGDYTDGMSGARFKTGEFVTLISAKGKRSKLQVEMALERECILLVPANKYKKGGFWRIIRLMLGV